jgi:hypothetical protein
MCYFTLFCDTYCHQLFGTRHSSVTCTQLAESHSVSMLIDALRLVPASNSNYFGYIQAEIMPDSQYDEDFSGGGDE